MSDFVTTTVEAVNIIFAWPQVSQIITWTIGFLIGGLILGAIIAKLRK